MNTWYNFRDIYTVRFVADGCRKNLPLGDYSAMTNKLLELLAIEGGELTTAFEKASIQGRGTSQEVADFREHAIQDFLARYFPFPYRIAKGNVIDSFGSESDSIDCLLVNPVHPHTIDSHEKFTVILADGIDAAIEVKPNIQDRRELERGLIQIASLKECCRVESPIVLQNKYSDRIIEHSKRIPGFIFSMKAKANPVDTVNEVIQYYHDNSTPLELQVDFIVVNGHGIISNIKHPEEDPIWKGATGYGWEEWGDQTLAGFLFRINCTNPAAARISEPPLVHYLRKLKIPNVIAVNTPGSAT